MAVKFSQFTTGSTLADIDYFVGYKGTDNIQIAKSLLSGTTYTIDVPAATTNINLAGSDATNDAITLELNNILEKMIIKNPSQWIWTHNRWK